MALVEIKRPTGVLTEDDSNGDPLVVKRWVIRGHRDAHGNYFERATNMDTGEERWYRVD